MIRPLVVSVGTVLVVLATNAAVAQAPLSANTMFEAKAFAPPASGGAPVHFNVQSWEIPSQNGATHAIPLAGFYVAHLLSGDIATTIDGQTTDHVPGAYWSVKAGATMQVRVLSEFAVLETLVPTKP